MPTLEREQGEAVMINLPLISPNPLSYRIRIENDVVPAIVRRAYFLLKDAVLGDRDTPLYVHGPRGVGKSYILYMLATNLVIRQRTAPFQTRVTYINDCEAWILGDHEYFLTELVATFFHDDVELNILSKVKAIQETFDQPTRNNQILKLLSELKAFVFRKNLRWFVIFDQLNAFQDGKSLSSTAELALRIVRLFEKTRSRQVTVLGSASANNERYSLDFEDWATFSIGVIPNRYNERECQLWCDHHQLVQTADSTREILYYTGGIPLELEVYNAIESESFCEKLEEYKSSRLEALIVSHRKFCESLTSPNDKMNLRECLGRMALYLSPPKYLTGMDRQLFVVEDKEGHGKRIVELFPLAREAVMSLHSDIIEDSLRMVAEVVFKDQSNYTNDVKGHVVKRYIIASLEEKMSYNFTCRKLGKRSDICFQGEIQSVVYFDGKCCPIRSTISDSVCTLIVPTSSECPGMDFFIWDPTDPQLLAVQVTTQQSLKGHIVKCNFMHSEWCRFLGIQEADISALWMAPKECIDVKDAVDNGLNNYVMAFDALVDLCPAIVHFQRCLKRAPSFEMPIRQKLLEAA